MKPKHKRSKSIIIIINFVLLFQILNVFALAPSNHKLSPFDWVENDKLISFSNSIKAIQDQCEIKGKSLQEELENNNELLDSVDLNPQMNNKNTFGNIAAFYKFQDMKIEKTLGGALIFSNQPPLDREKNKNYFKHWDINKELQAKAKEDFEELLLELEINYTKDQYGYVYYLSPIGVEKWESFVQGLDHYYKNLSKYERYRYEKGKLISLNCFC